MYLYTEKENVGLPLIAFPVEPIEFQSYFRGSLHVDKTEPLLPLIAPCIIYLTYYYNI